MLSDVVEACVALEEASKKRVSRTVEKLQLGGGK